MSQEMLLAEKLANTHDLSAEELYLLIANRTEETREYLRQKAEAECQRVYGNNVFIRGLIELTNYCKNDCYYCGIRCSNKKANRYRLNKQQILECCEIGYELGFRTFVLQGGEDPYFTDERMVDIVSAMRQKYPHCAITLSLGERSRESYQALFEAGANRYLLRHETATKQHYEQLHPAQMSFEHRMECLRTLKEIGFQTGCGFMVGSPGQTLEHIVRDLRFIKEFRPHMVGMGPFLSHHDTPFCDMPNGTAELTVYLLSIVRLLLPEVLLPATTALGTVQQDGRKQGVLAGCNVVMPNLSPLSVRKSYMLYDNKISTDEESAQSVEKLKRQMESIGRTVAVARGDSQIQ